MPFFLAGKTAEIDESAGSCAFYETADYCLDDCFASCENVVWISFKNIWEVASLLFMNIV